ncbi:MAG: response regulator [Candidatus Levybacteria bacterium]|nr:response regulator [Candidatus Levybacteria bacterium]
MAKILIVEDEKDLSDLYSDTLKEAGHEIETTDDGQEAYDKMKQGGYDLVLLDVILPHLNGLLIMEKLKAEPPQVPNKIVIFLTNLDRNEEIDQGLSLANGYLIKSQITPVDLVREINLYLSGQKDQPAAQ